MVIGLLKFYHNYFHQLVDTTKNNVIVGIHQEKTGDKTNATLHTVN
jgi:hypothetical protein